MVVFFKGKQLLVFKIVKKKKNGIKWMYYSFWIQKLTKILQTNNTSTDILDWYYVPNTN